MHGSDFSTLRISAFDHVRSIAVLFMIIAHLAEIFGSDTAQATLIGHVMKEKHFGMV